MTPDTPYILLDDQIAQDVRYYEDPIDVLRADTPEAVEGVFQHLADYHRQGYYLAGFCAYELGYALEPKFADIPHPSSTLPLLVFGVFKAPKKEMPLDLRYSAETPALTLTPEWDEADYLGRFERVIAYIKAGDIYQANLTFPARGPYAGSAHTLYAALRRQQPGHFGGVLRLFETDIISFSPELFFKKTGDRMSMRPMKGTRPRDLDPLIDQTLITDMQAEPKSRAENLMIVDLLRNDLSRISKPGSVKVPELFSVETYPTLHQMISKVESELYPETSFREIFKSLFPCGSVTGAPKIRAMEIISELEAAPRGAYCGALGYIDPDGQACFNVGIRTLSLTKGSLSYGIGSGVVLDSDGPDEYRECLLKAQILTPPKPALIETFLWTSDTGFQHLDAHLQRLKSSAMRRGYPYSLSAITQALSAAISSKISAQRIRLTLDGTAQLNVVATPYKVLQGPLRLCLSQYPLSSEVQDFQDKVTARDFYDGERQRVQARLPIDEVIFCNASGQICEGSFTSLFFERGGTLYTPPLSCGLLPGILRQHLITTGQATEAVLTSADVSSVSKLFVGNSLRGLIPAEFVHTRPI